MHKLSRTKRRYNLNKTPSKSRKHTKSVTRKGCPNYIKESNQHMIKHKVPKALSKNKRAYESNKHTCSKTYLIQEGKNKYQGMR